MRAKQAQIVTPKEKPVETPATPAAEAAAPQLIPGKSNVRLSFTNEDGTEVSAAVELAQYRIDEMLKMAQQTLSTSSKESTVAHVLHEMVIARMDRMPNVD